MSSAPARKLKLAPTPRWNYQQFGQLHDPVHKSYMNYFVGEFACMKSFKLSRDAEARGEFSEHANGKSLLGTAGHETIRRALNNPELRAKLLDGGYKFAPGSVRKVLALEYEKAKGELEVRWYGKDDEDDTLDTVEQQVESLLCDLHNHVAALELVEAGFIAKIGDIWVEGHIDLAFRPKSNPEQWAITDWKTGKRLPHQIVLDHGFESGFYSAGLRNGICVPPELVTEWKRLACDDRPIPLDAFEVPLLVGSRDDREAMHVVLRALARMREAGRELPEGVVTPGVFPEVIRLTMLQDYLTYQKNSSASKEVKRPEEIAHWMALSNGGTLMVVPDEKTPTGKEKKPVRVFDPETNAARFFRGMQKGPAWYAANRREDDIARLETLLRDIVGWVRMGKFPPNGLGEKCTRCRWQGPCLTDGYQARGDEAKQLASIMKDVEFDGFVENDT
jgi:hypothetical protein